MAAYPLIVLKGGYGEMNVLLRVGYRIHRRWRSARVQAPVMRPVLVIRPCTTTLAVIKHSPSFRCNVCLYAMMPDA